ncbi:MAG: hypothetical protein M3Z23_11120 [Acidobacteriota bacterium]|nr:hypothetical protein [Acidobacteriota bacterium]
MRAFVCLFVITSAAAGGTILAEIQAIKSKEKIVAAEQQQVFQAIQDTQQKLEEFKAGLGALDRKEADLRELAVVLTRNVDMLRAKRAEVAALETALGNTRSPFETEVSPLPVALPATKLPILVELFHERAIPVTKKNFYFDIPKFSGPMMATRTGIGETAAEISKPASSFNKFLDGIKPDKQFLSCLLNGDSFDIFRQVRKMAKAKGISVGWEPIDSSAGRITVYPVHNVKGTEQAKSEQSKSEKKNKLPRVAATQ